MPRRWNQTGPSFFRVQDTDRWRKPGAWWVREDWQKLDRNHEKEDVDDWHGPYETPAEAEDARLTMEADRGKGAAR